MEDLQKWFSSRIPEDWFHGDPEVQADRDEIVVRGRLRDLDGAAAASVAEAAALARIADFREETRPQRVRIAAEAERRFRRKVSWGASCGPVSTVFTHLAAPVMTRLRMNERAVVDTLVDAGVARSRSEALAWCVRLVADNEGEWIGRLRQALSAVEEVRAAGPGGA